jgi:hypothetical protein
MCAFKHAARLPRLLVAAALAAAAACDSPGGPDLRPAAALQLVNADSLTAAAGSMLGDSVRIRVVNRRGEPVSGSVVEFVPESEAGTVEPGNVVTDATGSARAMWTLGVRPGVQHARVRISGSNVPPLRLTAVATEPRSLNLWTRGDRWQTGREHRPLDGSLWVRLTDSTGQIVSGEPVLWSASSGVITPESDTTREDGIAVASWTPGSGTGTQTATVALRRQRATWLQFFANVLPRPAMEPYVISGSGQTATVGEPLASPLVVQVRDTLGRGVAGAVVTWSTTHGSLAPASDRTDAYGFSRAVWTLGTRAYGADALAATAHDSVWFGADATPGAAAEVRVGLSDTLVLHPATVRVWASAWDRYGNGLGDEVTLEWGSSDPATAVVVPDSGARSGTVSTRRGGTVSIRARTGSITGSQTLRVAAVQGDYDVTAPSMQSPDALSDAGHVLGIRNKDTVVVWRNGAEARLGYGGPITPSRAPAINSAGNLLVFNRPYPFGNIAMLYPNLGRSMLLGPGRYEYVGQWLTTDLNDSDQAVGIAGYDRRAGFLWQAGQTVQFVPPPDAPAETSTAAVAISQHGQVAVNATAPGWQAVYRWDDGRYTRVPVPGLACRSWSAADINSAGQIVANCSTASGDAAFLWTGTALVSLAPITTAVGINDRGEVVGSGQGGVYLWREGHAVRLQIDYGFTVKRVVAINNRGQILLAVKDENARLLTPLP